MCCTKIKVRINFVLKRQEGLLTYNVRTTRSAHTRDKFSHTIEIGVFIGNDFLGAEVRHIDFFCIFDLSHLDFLDVKDLSLTSIKENDTVFDIAKSHHIS